MIKPTSEYKKDIQDECVLIDRGSYFEDAFFLARVLARLSRLLIMISNFFDYASYIDNTVFIYRSIHFFF